MTILKYPKNGLYNICKEELSLCSSTLKNAINTTTYTVPSGFRYSAYMNSLEGELKGFLKEIDFADDLIHKQSQEYEDLEVEMTNDVKTIDNSLVSRRERLIKDL